MHGAGDFWLHGDDGESQRLAMRQHTLHRAHVCRAWCQPQELGHGSFVRGLETTATYLPDTEEFDIHSPSITSTKWWIGAAGQTATHSAVYARLIINGEDRGVHVFVVQIRDLETHNPMRGVSVGDCGAKMGRDGIDNGWIRFDHVRIPREQMMMKHSQVSASGEYTKPPRAELAYGALLGGRASMVKDSGDWLKLTTTIVVSCACGVLHTLPGVMTRAGCDRARTRADPLRCRSAPRRTVCQG